MPALPMPRAPGSPKPAQCRLLTILCLSCVGSCAHSGRSCSYPLSQTLFSFWWVMWWWPRWEMGILFRVGKCHVSPNLHQARPKMEASPNPIGTLVTVTEVTALGAESLH